MSFGFYPRPRVRLSKHKYHPERKFTCGMGKLIPIFCEEVLPNDFWKLSGKALIRTQPLIAPTYHRIDIRFMFYYVPYRLLMKDDDWQSFITGYNQSDGSASDVVLPAVKSPATTGWTTSSLFDYLGFVTGVPNFTSTSGAFASRAYAKIVNDWYINKYVTEELPMSLEQGLDTTTNTELFSMNWEDDYFTSASITTQLGEPVYLPIASEAPVIGNGTAIGLTDGTNNLGLSQHNSGSLNWGPLTTGSNKYGVAVGNTTVPNTTNSNAAIGLTSDATKSGLKADLSAAAAITIPELRKISQISLYQETMAYVGYRFVDWLYAMFGMRSSDARLQRSEFLGGTMAPLDISSVVQTSATSETDTPQGNLSGLGVSGAVFPAWKRRFEEHGVVLGLMCVMPRTGYQNGNRRMFNRETRFDYVIPMMQHLGQMPIYEQEIFAQSDGATTTVGGVEVGNKTTFGYQWQYEDMRYMPSTSHGDFKNSLQYWTLDRVFDKPQILNSDFVQSDPSNRIFAVQDAKYDTCLCDILYNITAWRPLARHGVPGYLDHPQIFGGING